MSKTMRDALARKRHRETHYDILIEDPTEAEAAFEKARQSLRSLEVKHGSDSPEADEARTTLEAARTALVDCSYRIRFRNLSPDAFEALVGEHKPSVEQQDKGEQWDSKTFTPALLAACAVDSGMTEEDWIAELASDRWSSSDRSGAFIAALSANVTPRSLTIPKG